MRKTLAWFGAHIVAILLAIAVFAVALSLYDWLHKAPPPNVAADKARVITIIKWRDRQDTASARVDKSVASTRKSVVTGRVAAERLDSTAVSVVDTSPSHAFALERERGDTLRAVGWRLSVALDTMTADRDRWHFVADTSVALLNHVQHDLEIATKPCRIARVIPCPSRTAVLVGTALVTYVVAKNPDKARKTVGAVFRLAIP